MPRLEDLQVPHLDQYFGIWAMHEKTFLDLAEQVNRMDLQNHIYAARSRVVEDPGQVAVEKTADGIAVMDISGTLMKFASSLTASTGTVFARRALRQLADDPNIKGIILRIDSPGGTVSGTSDLADEVADAAAKKPVVAYVEDLAASAAYWIGSQATQMIANRTALVGSIGTFAVVPDYSAFAAKEGIKVHVVRAGEFKGSAEPGTEVTAKQLEEYQRIINEMNDHFLRGVAGGRKLTLTEVKKLADGRVHVAADAAAMGLIDGVSTFDKVLSNLRKQIKANAKKEKTMSDEAKSSTETVTAPPSASLAELKAAMPDADAGFLVRCLEQGCTVAAATGAWMDQLRAKNLAATKEIEDLKAKASKPGVPALKSEQSDGSDKSDLSEPITAFNAAVQEKVKGGMNKAQAIAAVVKEQPELHSSYLEVYNTQRGRKG